VLANRGFWLPALRSRHLGDTDTETSPPSSTAAERFTALQKIALAALLTANFTPAVDFSILNVALPHIGREPGVATKVRIYSRSRVLAGSGAGQPLAEVLVPGCPAVAGGHSGLGVADDHRVADLRARTAPRSRG